MAVLLVTAACGTGAARPQRVDSLLFKPQALHNHGSCIVELPNGQILACWYRGSGERTADDVSIMGSRYQPGRGTWGQPFTMADTPGFPDTNPCMVVDREARLHLIWPVILAHTWESALLRHSIATNLGRGDTPPRWSWSGNLLIKPEPGFAETLARDLPAIWAPYRAHEGSARLDEYLTSRLARSRDKLSVRLGWMPRAHAVVLPSGRMLLPLYSDLFDISLVARSDDHGSTFECSNPILGAANVQPAIARRKDGSLVAYFRDNGPPPQRVMVSESRDEGATWSYATDTELRDPGAGVDVVVLRDGRWLLVNNDTEDGRHSLAITISNDEGHTWTHKRHLEHDSPGPEAGSYSYPSIIQARDGAIHITYSCRHSKQASARFGEGETIKHVRLALDWLAGHD